MPFQAGPGANWTTLIDTVALVRDEGKLAGPVAMDFARLILELGSEVGHARTLELAGAILAAGGILRPAQGLGPQ